MPDIKSIADKADVIVNGYAFTHKGERIQVLNLNSPNKAVVFSTTMDDIELSIANRYLQQNMKYMEE